MAFLSKDGRSTRVSEGLSQPHRGRKSRQQLPIGVFDSGSGGLTVLKELQAQLPRESFLYFGDTANVPYGTQPQANILGYSRQILDWMTQYPVKMAIMACNTSSALALDAVRSEFSIPILGIILPGARAAAVQGKRIGVIATPATVASDSYQRAILEKNPQAEVFQVACPEFVPLIEGNLIHEPATLEIVRQRLQPLLEAQIDTLVYGCTHYPHLAPVIEELLPKSVHIVNPAVRMAAATAQELSILQLHTSRRPQRPRFFVSGCPKQFADLSKQWLGRRPWVDQVIFADGPETTPEISTADATAEKIVL
ncbi:Glutamate racemase [Acaryochloris thomasi RCC1774]|uniref:Glutamate racemase n=1 Tax=Acaryochloris thomasi RCC1774 TaxID=1764569 RepID=A0A2W1JMU5_9CYAN|nr:Glutamate racemase [Acaryochloris thomasi RCC1774]